jgi:hypothetical protein
MVQLILMLFVIGNDNVLKRLILILMVTEWVMLMLLSLYGKVNAVNINKISDVM